MMPLSGCCSVVDGIAGALASPGGAASVLVSPDAAGVPDALGRLGERSRSAVLLGCLPRGIVAMGPRGVSDGRSVADGIGGAVLGAAWILTFPVLTCRRHALDSPAEAPVSAASPPIRLSP